SRAAGRVWITSFATISPDARGDATAGRPKLGNRAKRKRAMRSARRTRDQRRLTRPPYFLATLPDACRDSAPETWPCTSGNDGTAEALPRNRTGLGFFAVRLCGLARI